MALDSQQSKFLSVKRKKNNASKKKNPRNKGRSKEPSNNPHKTRKIDPKVKKYLRKKARDYNSDDEDEADASERIPNEEPNRDLLEAENDDIEEKENSGSEEDGEIEPGIAKFSEGFRAFRIAFKSIMNISGSEKDPLGPVLSAHKKLVAEKLAEEDAERKARGETKKEKHLVAEKGHVKPDSYLNTHEKFLIGIATKGVVKLFNAVTKAQNAQRGLNPSRTKDANAIKKRRKEAFYSEIAKPSKEPTWAPLRENFMLTNPKFKNWDKGDQMVDDDVNLPNESSSDED